MGKMDGLTVRERIEIFVKSRYYDWWACPRGHHYMKMSGCVYCGAQETGRSTRWRS